MKREKRNYFSAFLDLNMLPLSSAFNKNILCIVGKRQLALVLAEQYTIPSIAWKKVRRKFIFDFLFINIGKLGGKKKLSKEIIKKRSQ